MAFDKTKVLRSGEKSLTQGKIQAAIKDYSQVAENDPSDFTVLNMLGDLYVRTGKKGEAASCFGRIAEHFRDEGFSLKAIAMYKKIDRLSPGSPETANSLATLYESQGLIVDARTQYLTVIDAYIKSGQSQKALEVLRKVADLDPNNIDLRLRLAEGYVHERFHSEAASAFFEAGEQFLAREDYDRALDAFTRSLKIIPQDPAAMSGLVSTYIKRGTPEDAADLLEEMVASRPDDIDLLSMLASTYVQAGEAASAERATTALVEQQAVNYIRFVEVVQLYLKENDTESAVRILGNIAEQMLSGREEVELLGLVNDVLSRDPDHVKALRLLVRIYWWQRDVDKLRATLERLAEAAESANLIDDQRSALAQLVQLAPDQPAYAEKLRRLGSAEGEVVESVPMPAPLLGQVPTFENFALVQDDRPAPVSNPPSYETNAESSSSQASDPASSFADLNDWTDVGSSDASPAPVRTPAPAMEIGFQEFDLDSVHTDAPAAEESSSVGQDPRYESAWQQELESVDFYIAQGYIDIAQDTLDMLERQFGQNEQIQIRRRQLAESAASAEKPQSAEIRSDAVEIPDLVEYDLGGGFAEPDTQQGDVDLAFSELELGTSHSASTDSASKASPSESSGSGAGLDPGLAAIFEEFRAAAEEEEPQPEGNDYETHYNLGLAYKEMDLLDEAIEEFQFAAGLVAPKDGTPRYLQCCNLLGHCFMQKGMPRAAVMWYAKGLEAPGHTQDEYQALRFELGSAYEQMGDIDHAIDVFTEVYGVSVSYRGVSDKLRSLQAQKSVNTGS